jgi:hypothetical protein
MGIRAHQLFLERQRLVRSLLGKERPAILEGKKRYLGIRGEEEELELQKWILDNERRQEPLKLERKRRPDKSRDTSRLRMWMNIIIITLFLVILLMLIWEPQIKIEQHDGSQVPPHEESSQGNSPARE